MEQLEAELSWTGRKILIVLQNLRCASSESGCLSNLFVCCESFEVLFEFSCVSQ